MGERLSDEELELLESLYPQQHLLSRRAAAELRARRAADLTPEDVDLLRWAHAELTDSEFITSEKSKRFISILAKLTKGAR